MKQQKMTASKLKEALDAAGCYVDTVSVSGGVFVVRKGFFYQHGGSAEKLAARVLTALPQAEVVDSGSVWKPFRGGASVAAQSHWWVKLVLPQGPMSPEAVSRWLKQPVTTADLFKM